MSTKLHDLANSATLLSLLSPQTVTATVTSSGVDLLAADHRCAGILSFGEVTGTAPSLAGKFQESDALSSGYADITGATFTATGTSETLQIIGFNRSKRYVRFVGTITGTSPSFTLAVVVLQQKKQL